MDVPDKCVKDAANVGQQCRNAAQAYESSDQLRFLDLLLADLTEARDDLAHQAAVVHPPHEP